MRKALPVVPFCTCAISNSPALSVTLFHSFILPHFLFWSWLLEDTEPFSCSSSSSCPFVNIDKSEHRILTFSTTMSAPNQPMQPAYIQKSGHSHGNQWTHGLFDCFSPFDTCKLPAPASLPFVPTTTCGDPLSGLTPQPLVR